MNQRRLPHAFKYAYPYWVAGRILAMILGSLIFLALHGSIRQVRSHYLRWRGQTAQRLGLRTEKC